ncbi:alpha-L-fucosidase [Mucilaginibacter sp. X4EP1]|uniref:alpha-L-fucosidase n=1 Tax=Mucilaginibacter sp. X4EP1 TaxID=2723092 RepID=UPI0021697ED6|nr:alpha-L-fucosidase [Mucilaginibacter sp. X4EP1]MCS3812658.1 alpha-L-fucosidase [Mucilaginibacter sp. X4EP1]
MITFYKSTFFLLSIFLGLFIFVPARCQTTVLPTSEQVAWADAEIGVIIHLDINIYAPESFDYKDSRTLPDVNLFNPSKLNTDQWVCTAKAAGATYAILTVKHGTGFCLWPSKVNNYNVGHTKWRNGTADILRAFIVSCKKYGLKPGLYYNTNSNTYYNAGYQPFVSDSAHIAYNKAVLGQLTELWSNYGKMFEIWFDGGVNGIEPEVLKLIHTLQSKAILFQGPVSVKNIIRWIGNEDGIAAYPQWSRANTITASNGLVRIDELHGDPDGQVWCPCESDFPIRKNNAWNGGWLWRANQENYLFTIKELTDKYYKSVGRNTNMLVGMVVDTSGLIPRQDSLVFDSLGKNIRKLFSKPVISAKQLRKKIITLQLSTPKQISQVIIKEDIRGGENVRRYLIQAMVGNKWINIAAGRSIGHKRIQKFTPVNTNKIRLSIQQATEKKVTIKEITFF